MKKLTSLIIAATASLSLVGCNGGGGGSSSPSQGMNISVSPNSSSICGNLNAPCVSLTICDSSNSNCSTVPNVLVDTGSYGLRLFQSVLNTNTVSALTQITDNSSNPVGECVSYGDGSQNWGGVYSANIQLASNATASSVPIQIINSSFQTPPAQCYNASTSPASFGYNGVLGVGVYVADGGSYFSCSSGSCSSYSLPTSKQVSNPIAMLPSNNNGLTISFNDVDSDGDTGVTGLLSFGVNTNDQNTVSTSNQYPASLQGGLPLFNANFSNNQYYAFLDTGTNTFSMTNSEISACGSPYTDWFCPSSTTSLQINNINSNGQAVLANVSIANTLDLFNTGNTAFNNIGTALPNSFGGQYIDYGLPFFFGKTVQIVFNGKSSNNGNGPFWAW